MLFSNLKFNNGKTELLVLHSKHRPQRSLDSIAVGDASVIPTQDARNIGAIFDCTMNLNKHVNEICKTSFYQIRNISRVRILVTIVLRS
jgi:hypothetical protein